MSKPQQKHENLYQRRGVWWIRYNVAGRKERRSLKTTSIREARRLRDQILGKRSAAVEVREAFGIVAAGESGAPVPTVREVADRFLAYEVGRGRLRPRSATMLRGQVNNWVVPELGPDRRITAIGFEDIELFLGRVRSATAKRKRSAGGKLGREQVSRIFRVTSRMFRYAVRRGIVPANPCDLLERGERPTPGKAATDYLTFEELGRLLAELGEGQLAEMVSVAFYTGLRWGEVTGLAWADLDLQGSPATLTPRRSYAGPLKNEASGDAIELHPDVAGRLRLFQADAETPWVFPSPAGKLQRRMPDADRERIRKAATAAGITKRVTPHVFRHSFGTHLYAATHDIHLVKRAMRHSNVQITMGLYVKDTGASMAEAVAALPSIATRARLKSV